MKTVKRTFTIPIFDVKVKVIICDTPKELYIEYEKMHGISIDKDYYALVELVSYKNQDKPDLFLLYLPRDCAHSVICHEIYHLTRRVCEYVNCDYGVDHHEHEALLFEWLIEKIMGIYEKASLPYMELKT